MNVAGQCWRCFNTNLRLPAGQVDDAWATVGTTGHRKVLPHCILGSKNVVSICRIFYLFCVVRIRWSVVNMIMNISVP